MDEKYEKWNTANPHFYYISREFQKELRKNRTPAERLLWECVRRKQLGHKIRRQHIIDVFIIDFVCVDKLLVIELDGKIHEYQKDYDEVRTERLNEMGFRVIRFTNEDIMNDLGRVLNEIKEHLVK